MLTANIGEPLVYSVGESGKAAAEVVSGILTDLKRKDGG